MKLVDVVIILLLVLSSITLFAHDDTDHTCHDIDGGVGFVCLQSVEEATPTPEATPTLIPTPVPVNSERQDLLLVLDTIPVRAESRCSSYTRHHYEHGVSGSGERRMAEELDWVLPYSNVEIDADDLYGSRGTQIEHMVAASEAHESGMCSRSTSERRAFGRDASNLTLALPSVNRAKSAKDLSEWLPENNLCWFVSAIVNQKAEWNLSMDRDEWDTAKSTIEDCDTFSIAS